MAISNVVKNSPLKGIGDPNQGFGFTSLLNKNKAVQPAPANNLNQAKNANQTPSTNPIIGVSSPSSLSQAGLLPVPKKDTQPIVNPIQAQIDATKAQISQLQGQKSAIESAGYKPDQQVKKDSMGNIIPAQTAYPASPTGQGFQVAPTASAFAQTASQLSQFDPTKQPGFKEAQSAYQQKVNELENLKKDYAEKTTQIQGRPGSNLTLASGQQGLLNQQFLSSQAAAQGAVQQQQSAIEQALTASGQRKDALSSSASLVSPSNVPYFTDPTTGQVVGGGGLSGPQVAANMQSIADQTSQVNAYGAARQSSMNLQAQLENFIKENNVNPSDLNAVNRLIQGVASQTSSPKYQTFSNLVNDLASAYAQILTPAGGSQTDMVRQIAQSLLSATASGKSIIQVMQDLDNQAQTKIAGIQQNIQAIQSGQNTNPPVSTSTGNTVEFNPDGTLKAVSF